MKKSSETKKTHTCFLKIGEEMMQKWRLKCVTRSVWVRFSWERNGEDSEQSQKFEWKTEKVLKTVFKTQNIHFLRLKWVANKSPGLATKTLKDKIMKKKFLSVFRDWKVYPRGSRELSCENLCVPLTTEPFTCKQVAKINTRARSYSMRLGWPATELPKQGNTVFEIF